MSRLLITALVFMLSGVGGVHAQSDGAWQTMALSDFREPSQTDPLQTTVWPDAIRDANAYAARELKKNLNGKNAWVTALSTRFEDKGRSIILSTVLTRACESGANHVGAGVERSICPLRIVALDRGKSTILREDRGCYIDPPDASLPAQNQGDSVQARFDPASGQIQMRAIIGGRLIAECARSYPTR